jgi:hypothetical protein
LHVGGFFQVRIDQPATGCISLFKLEIIVLAISHRKYTAATCMLFIEPNLPHEAYKPCPPMQAYFVPDTAVAHQSSLNRCSAHLNAAALAPGYVDRWFVHVRTALTKGKKKEKTPGTRRESWTAKVPMAPCGRSPTCLQEQSRIRRAARPPHHTCGCGGGFRHESRREMDTADAAGDTTHTPQ